MTDPKTEAEEHTTAEPDPSEPHVPASAVAPAEEPTDAAPADSPAEDAPASAVDPSAGESAEDEDQAEREEPAGGTPITS